VAVLKSIEAGRTRTGNAHSGIALDLGDLRREAERLEREARAQADAILSEAREERARIVAGAAEEGHMQGYEKGLGEGREAGRAEGHAAALSEMRSALQSITGSWRDALEELIDRRERMASDARRDLVALAAEIARRVVKRSIELDGTLVVDQVRAALELVMRRTRLVLAVHPDDRALVEGALPDLTTRFGESAHVELTTDDSLSRGSCVIGTEHGRIDGEVEAQLDRMVEAMLGRTEPSTPPGAGASGGDVASEPGAES
jgi:flagellar biosynthesis/type III secretory pathway protein FliH